MSSPALVSSPAAVKSPSNQPPPGFKYVKKRKPDGKVVTVKVALSPEELANADYDIVTVRKPDGSLVKVRRPKTNGTPHVDGAKTVPAVSEANPTTSAPEAVSPAVASSPEAEPKPVASNLEAAPIPVASAPATEKANSNSPVAASHIVNDASIPRSDPTVVSNSPVGPTIDNSNTNALAEQNNAVKASRFARFKSSMMAGVTSTAGAVLFPEIMAGDELVNLSDDDESDVETLDENDEVVDDPEGDRDISTDRADDNAAPEHDAEKYGEVAAAGAAGVLAGHAAASKNTHTVAGATPTMKADGVTIMEKSVEDGASDKDKKLPPRRWMNASFYFLASLSIILPVLFVILTIIITIMDGHSVDGHYHKVPAAIKIAVSLWPILFAAVVAQAFKTYATYKVERGITIIELEQLVGSSSFASTIKQPLTLRQINLLTIFMFVVWALSPIGSQALQRVVGESSSIFQESQIVHVAQNRGVGQLFSIDGGEQNNEKKSALMQALGIAFTSALLPNLRGRSQSSAVSDKYGHPILQALVATDNEDLKVAPPSLWGLPVVMPPSIVQQYFGGPNAVVPKLGTSETFLVDTTTSNYNLTCGDWNTVNGSDLIPKGLLLSSGNTLGFKLSSSNNSSGFNHLIFAAFAEGHYITNDTTPIDLSDSSYNLIDCDFEQLYFSRQINCTWNFNAPFTDEPVPGCEEVVDKAAQITENIDPSWHTNLVDFSEQFVSYGVGGALVKTGDVPTIVEIYAEDVVYGQVDTVSYNSSFIAEAIPPEAFAYKFGQMFNTWTSLANCIECTWFTTTAEYGWGDDPFTQSKFDNKTITIEYSVGTVFSIDIAWLVVLYLCTVGLMFVGIFSVALESRLVAPDVLGYVNTTVRNSRYLHVPPTTSTMSGGERARRLGGMQVMMQDVRPGAEVGKIALGLKTDGAQRLQAGKLYR